MSRDPKRIKNIVIIGDGDTGKTSLLYKFTDGDFNPEYTPTIYDNQVIELKLNNVNYSVKLHDTAGQEAFETLRKISYRTADAFIICYSISQPASYKNIILKWSPELNQTNPYTPTLLVGTKCDLRTSNKNENILTTADGEELKEKIGSVSFLECSAKTFINVNEVFYEAVRASTIHIKKRRGRKKKPLFNCFR